VPILIDGGSNGYRKGNNLKKSVRKNHVLTLTPSLLTATGAVQAEFHAKYPAYADLSIPKLLSDGATASNIQLVNSNASIGTFSRVQNFNGIGANIMLPSGTAKSHDE